MADLHTRAMWGTFWSYVQNWAARGLTLVTFFVLARLLNPIEFGAFAVAAVFLTLAEVFVEQGLGHAIVQRPILEEKHISTAFWVTLSMGCALALLTFVLARPVSLYFDNVEIGPIAIALTPIFILMALSSIPAALLRRELKYKVLAKRSLLANVISGVVAIVMAANGFGVWSFVGQQIAFHSIGVIVLWKNETWRPRFIVSLVHLSQLGDFSIKMILVKLLDFFETRVIDLVVARQLGLNALGSYSLATRAYQAVVQLIAAPVWESTNSSFARMQQDQNAMRKAFLDMNVFVAIIVVPVFLLMSVTASGLIPGVFGVKWIPSVTTFQVLCLLGAIRAISFISGSLLQAGGRAGLSLGIAALRAVLSFCALYYLIGYGLVGVACSILIGQILVLPLSYFFIWKFQHIGVNAVFKKIAKPISAAVLSAFASLLMLREILSILPPLLAAGICLIFGMILFCVLLIILMPRTLAGYLNVLPQKLFVPMQRLINLVIQEQESIEPNFLHFVLRFISNNRQSKARSLRVGQVVIVPSDASNVCGGLGDQALFGGLAEGLRDYGITRVLILCNPGSEMPSMPGIDVQPLALWRRWFGFSKMVRTMRDSDAVIIIGADTLDGFYSRLESLMRFGLAQLAARIDVPCRVISFSFNDNPDLATVKALSNLPDKITLCVRDAFSVQRVAKATGKPPLYVADIGFLLKPNFKCVVDSLVESWCLSHRQQHRAVIGWNIGPHCIKLLSRKGVEEAVESCVHSIRRLIEEQNVAVILIPHDFRSHASDIKLLTEIRERLNDIQNDKLLLLKEKYTASEVKAACQHLDFLFTGRMHLMIAALGMGVPVAGVEYQGKCAGLLEHFEITAANLITPEDLCDREVLYYFVLRCFTKRAETQSKVRSALPNVILKAKLNFVGL